MDKEQRILFEKHCENGDIENIMKITMNGTDEEELKKIYEFGFLLACAYNQIDVVKFFVNEFNINVHSRDETGFHWACANGSKDIVLYLLSLTGENYINVHTEDEYAFRYACLRGHEDIVGILLKLEDDREINYRALNDFSLKWACRTNEMSIIQLLVDRYCKDKIDIFSVIKIENEYFSNRVMNYLKTNRHIELKFEELVNLNQFNPVNRKTQERCIISYDDIDDFYLMCSQNDEHIVKLDVFKRLKDTYCPICIKNPFKEIVYKQTNE